MICVHSFIETEGNISFSKNISPNIKKSVAVVVILSNGAQLSVKIEQYCRGIMDTGSAWHVFRVCSLVNYSVFICSSTSSTVGGLFEVVWKAKNRKLMDVCVIACCCTCSNLSLTRIADRVIFILFAYIHISV